MRIVMCDAYGAEVYDVEIAKDANFQNVIWIKEVMSNIVKVDATLDVGETYYWRVTAKNKSKDMGATWQCAEAGESFKVYSE